MTKGAPLGHLFFYAVPLLLGNWLRDVLDPKNQGLR